MPTRSRIAADLALDLGSAHTRIVMRGRGVVLDVPTVVATSTRAGSRELVAIGQEAADMMGRAPADTQVARPVRGGVVADFEATERLVRALLEQVGATGLRRPRVLMCVPSGTSDVERRAVQESARAAGAGVVLLVASPIAAALGAELPIRDPVASMIVDIGAGRTHVAILSLGGIVVRGSVPVAGDALDAAIVEWIRVERGLAIGERAAETLKLRVASLMPDPRLTMRIRGRDESTGRPREEEVVAEDLADAMDPTIQRIRRLVLDTLSQTPPELAADIVDRGLLMCGGTGQLRGLDAILREDTGLPVLRVTEPTRCVARGAERLLDDVELLERVADER